MKKNKKRFKFYIYYSYKDRYYHLFDRIDFNDKKFLSFRFLYDYINEHNIPYESLRLKSMTLKEFFSDYACFENEGSDKI